MRKLFLILLLALLLSPCVHAQDVIEREYAMFGAGQLQETLPEAVRSELGRLEDMETSGDFVSGLSSLLSGAGKDNVGRLKASLGLCLSIFAVVMLAAVLRGLGQDTGVIELAATLSIAMICFGQISGFFTRTAETVDAMSVFSAGLFSSLAAATAATGAAGTSAALYGVTAAVCSVLTRALDLVLLPAISCYMALTTANYAVGDGSLQMAADTLKQLLTGALKFSIIGFTAFLSLTGVVSGSADSAAIRAAKLTLSTTVPVVGSIIADASETLLVSAGMVRNSLGIFGLLGVLAVSIGPFLETGVSYLLLKCTAAASAATGEKYLSGLISAMAGAIGLITAITGTCAFLLLIGCVCFMKVSIP